jgi:hypothetical protein
MFAGWYYVVNQASNGAACCHTMGGCSRHCQLGVRVAWQGAPAPPCCRVVLRLHVGILRQAGGLSTERNRQVVHDSVAMKDLGKPGAGEPHARFDERGLETEHGLGIAAPATSCVDSAGSIRYRASPRLYPYVSCMLLWTDGATILPPCGNVPSADVGAGTSIGDAAHVMHPYLDRGTRVATEDACAVAANGTRTGQSWIAAGSIDTRHVESSSPTVRGQRDRRASAWIFGYEAGSEDVLAARW